MKVEVSAGRYRYSVHALEQMLEKGIRVNDVENALGRDDPELIEDYPFHVHGPCCLILGWADLARPLHAVVGYPAYSVVTVYEPDSARWVDYRQRAR